MGPEGEDPNALPDPDVLKVAGLLKLHNSRKYSDPATQHIKKTGKSELPDQYMMKTRAECESGAKPKTAEDLAAETKL